MNKLWEWEKFKSLKFSYIYATMEFCELFSVSFVILKRSCMVSDGFFSSKNFVGSIFEQQWMQKYLHLRRNKKILFYFR